MCVFFLCRRLRQDATHRKQEPCIEDIPCRGLGQAGYRQRYRQCREDAHHRQAAGHNEQSNVWRAQHKALLNVRSTVCYSDFLQFLLNDRLDFESNDPARVSTIVRWPRCRRRIWRRFNRQWLGVNESMSRSHSVPSYLSSSSSSSASSSTFRSSSSLPSSTESPAFLSLASSISPAMNSARLSKAS